jgi:hypothetical protein
MYRLRWLAVAVCFLLLIPAVEISFPEMIAVSLLFSLMLVAARTRWRNMFTLVSPTGLAVAAPFFFVRGDAAADFGPVRLSAIGLTVLVLAIPGPRPKEEAHSDTRWLGFATAVVLLLLAAGALHSEGVRGVRTIAGPILAAIVAFRAGRSEHEGRATLAGTLPVLAMFALTLGTFCADVVQVRAAHASGDLSAKDAARAIRFRLPGTADIAERRARRCLEANDTVGAKIWSGVLARLTPESDAARFLEVASGGADQGFRGRLLKRLVETADITFLRRYQEELLRMITESSQSRLWDVMARKIGGDLRVPTGVCEPRAACRLFYLHQENAARTLFEQCRRAGRLDEAYGRFAADAFAGRIRFDELGRCLEVDNEFYLCGETGKDLQPDPGGRLVVKNTIVPKFPLRHQIGYSARIQRFRSPSARAPMAVTLHEALDTAGRAVDIEFETRIVTKNEGPAEIRFGAYDVTDPEKPPLPVRWPDGTTRDYFFSGYVRASPRR